MHKDIIVVGAGIAGLRIAKKLGATLISSTDTFVFMPRLPDMLRNPREQATLRITDCHNDFIKDTITKVDTKKSTLHTKQSVFTYDYLVVATGASPATVIPGTEKYAHFFYHLHDVKDLQNTKKQHVVVIGAGPTGVEVAAEFSEDNAVTLLQANPQIIPYYSTKTRKYATERLRENSVNIKTKCMVEKITKSYIHTNNEKIPYDVCVCSAGVKANTLPGLPTDKGILVNNHLQVKGTQNVFAAGDCAETGNPLTAQAAKYEADLVVKNIRAHKKESKMKQNAFKSRGMFLLLSEHVALDSKLSIHGRIAKLLRTAYYNHLLREYSK